MKKLLLLCSIFFGIGFMADAQTFVERIDTGNGDFVQHSIAQLVGGDYVLAGTQSPGLSGGTDVKLLRIDNTGSVVWSKNFDFGGTDSFVGSIIVGEGNEIALTGYVGINNGPKDLLITKIDSNGNLLAELTLNDPAATGFGYQLYGTDIVQKENGDYLVVGIGTDFITAGSPKYNFVLSVDHNLNGFTSFTPQINEGNFFNQSNNSFNSITKVPSDVSPNGQEMFLLTGTTTDALGFSEGFMTLIDGNGVASWSQSYNGEASHQNGGMAIFNPSTSLFYVTYPWIEGQLETLTVDFTSGNIIDSYFIYAPDENLVSMLLNGMVLDTHTNNTSIAYSAFMFNSQFDTGIGRHMAFSIDYDNSNATVNWQQLYRSEFNIADVLNVNFDFIVQPLNYGSNPNSALSNSYYTPKGGTINDNKTHLIFTGLQQNPATNQLSLSLFRTTLSGEVQCDCVLPLALDIDVISTSIGNNFNQNMIPFVASQTGLNLFNSPFNLQLSCTQANYCGSAPQPRPLGLMDEVKDSIQLYPNPVKDELHIKAAANTKVRIYDIQSKLILQQAINNNAEIINLRHLQQGVYFAKFTSSTGEVQVKKVIKK